LLDLRILADYAGFILEWTSRNTDDRGDRWYGTVAEAVAEAREYFGVAENEWLTSDVAS
jgi:hypothetical protein